MGCLWDISGIRVGTVWDLYGTCVGLVVEQFGNRGTRVGLVWALRRMLACNVPLRAQYSKMPKIYLDTLPYRYILS